MLLALERGERVPSVSLAEAVIAGYALDGQAAQLVRSAALPHVGRDSPFRRGYRTPRQQARQDRRAVRAGGSFMTAAGFGVQQGTHATSSGPPDAA